MPGGQHVAVPEDLFRQSRTLRASPDFKEKKRGEMEEILAVQNTFG